MANEVKSVKEELLDALAESLRLIEARKNVLQLQESDEAQKEQDAVVKQAGEDIESGIFAADLVQEYHDLVAAIEALEGQLKNWYGVAEQYLSQEVIAGAESIAMERMNASYSARQAELDSEWADADKALKEKKALGARDSDRAKKEFDFELKRDRDQKAAQYKESIEVRVAEIQGRIDASRAALDDATARNAAAEELELKVAAIPDELAKAYADGFTAGKKEAGASYGIEKTLAEKDRATEIAKLKMQIDMLTKSLEAKGAQVARLETKVDEAYSSMQDLSVNAVNAQGGVRIISTGSGGATSVGGAAKSGKVGK